MRMFKVMVYRLKNDDWSTRELLESVEFDSLKEAEGYIDTMRGHNDGLFYQLEQ